MATKARRVKVEDKNKIAKKKNKFVFIMDASGSMAGLRDKVVRLLNEQLATLKKEFYANDMETDVSIMTFDYSYNINYVYQDVHISKARNVTTSDYRPNGYTALNDAVGRGINDFLGHNDFNDENTSFVVIAYTDGEENDSKVYAGSKLATLIRKAQDTRRFTVTLQVPRGNKAATRSSTGIPTDNIAEWEATEAGIKEASMNTSAGIRSYLTARSKGATSVQNFYVQTDLSNLKTSQLKRELEDLSSDFGIFVAKNEGQIRDFVEEKTGNVYVKGEAYYQLMKTETVQADKEILIYDKTKLALYGGDEARTLIGLPIGANAKVVPGNHANFEVFVQSTSVNRLVKVGQKIAIKVSD